MATTPKIKMWRRELDRIYQDQLGPLVINHHVFRQLRAVWQQHGRLKRGVDLSQWMMDCYVAYVATAIRRITEPKPKRARKTQRTLSLAILLENMSDDNALLTREWFVSLYSRKSPSRQFANRDFDRLAGTRARLVSKRSIQSDLAALRRVAAPIKRLADKVVAHTEVDRRKHGRPQWRQVDEAVDLLVQLYEKYYLLLNAREFLARAPLGTLDVTADAMRIWPAVK